MLSSLRTKQRVSASINGEVIEVSPDETLLQAADREGVDFPSACRVGGCGTCKCRVLEGEVRELTETAYLLSAEEIDSGTVLACQSVALSDLVVEVDRTQMARWVPGLIVGQERVTHDITELTVRLEEPLEFRAGQFTNLALDGLDGVARSYSFAAPADRSGRVSFCIRRVPGGQMSTLVNDEDLIGCHAFVDGPQGDFWLRDGDEPIVAVAGGSGLAPIVAMLEDAMARGVRRPVTLLFGAREQRDLYGLDRIATIKSAWNGAFEFVPVLSHANDDQTWGGARGLVTEHITRVANAEAHAYLCGPPPMVDAAVDRLTEAGVDPAVIRFDRFVTAADAAVQRQQKGDYWSPALDPEAPGDPDAGFLDYLKFFGFHVVGLAAAVGIFAGGAATVATLLGVLALYIVGDVISGNDTSTPRYRRPRLLTYQLWAALPLLAVIVIAAIWSVSSGDSLGLGGLIERVSGYDVIAARNASGLGVHVSAFLLTGLMIGIIGTVTAHELTHRTWDRASLVIGRWLLAFSFDTNFAIEHVYGHHRYVSTTHDPATAPRGRNVYVHVVASTIKGNVSAWRIEVERLGKKRLPVWSHHNAVLRGQSMSIVLLVAAFAIGGWGAVGFFALCGLAGKALLEIVNYMEHYGMVRDPDTPVQPRHSWNTNRRVSSWTLFNLTRHSHHHAQGEVPYQDLRPMPNAPEMVSGYLTTLVVALIPPVWHRLMTPRVLDWDRSYATAHERELAAAANRASGVAALVTAGQQR